MGCGTLGSLDTLLENSTSENSSARTALISDASWGRGQVAPKKPMARRHGSRGRAHSVDSTSINSKSFLKDKKMPMLLGGGAIEMQDAVHVAEMVEKNSRGISLELEDEDLDEPAFEKKSDENALIDMENPLHVVLYEFGKENLLPHAHEFFARVNAMQMVPTDLEIMQVIREKALFDENFGDWVHAQLYPDEVQKNDDDPHENDGNCFEKSEIVSKIAKFGTPGGGGGNWDYPPDDHL